LGETTGEAGRTFVVNVHLKNPDAQEKVKYIVIGINPLWVFRQEDYETLAQWTCGRLQEVDPSGANAGADEPGLQDSQGAAGNTAVEVAVPTENAAERTPVGESGDDTGKPEE
jgi:hypothetical protein